MALRLAQLEEADIPTYTQVELDAFRSHPRTPMVWTTGENASVHAYINTGKRKGMCDSNEHSLKCLDTRSGTFTAGATYTFAFTIEDSSGQAVAMKLADPIDEDAPPPPNWPDGGNWAIARFYKINTPKVIQQYLGGRPYISNVDAQPFHKLHTDDGMPVLDNLTVRPDYQGKGIGQRLLVWGAEQADNLNIEMCLESTPAGRRLYESFGFRERTIIKADMYKLGWPEPYDDEAAARIFMVREPGATRPRLDWREPF